MIKTFADKATAAVFLGLRVKRLPPQIQAQARQKFLLIDSVQRIEDLRLPPSNHLEKLSGDRVGQWSIRINDQWRVCFRFEHGDAFEVEIVDYH
jgi:proteic killer suppression protein